MMNYAPAWADAATRLGLKLRTPRSNFARSDDYDEMMLGLGSTAATPGIGEWMCGPYRGFDVMAGVVDLSQRPWWVAGYHFGGNSNMIDILGRHGVFDRLTHVTHWYARVDPALRLGLDVRRPSEMDAVHRRFDRVQVFTLPHPACQTLRTGGWEPARAAAVLATSRGDGYDPLDVLGGAIARGFSAIVTDHFVELSVPQGILDATMHAQTLEWVATTAQRLVDARRALPDAPWESQIAGELQRAAQAHALTFDPARYAIDGRVGGQPVRAALTSVLARLRVVIEVDARVPPEVDVWALRGDEPRPSEWFYQMAKLQVGDPQADAAFHVHGAPPQNAQYFLAQYRGWLLPLLACTTQLRITNEKLRVHLGPPPPDGATIGKAIEYAVAIAAALSGAAAPAAAGPYRQS